MASLESVCRLCMGTSNVVHNIVEDNLLQMIAICVSLLISPDNETLPLGVCALCTLKLKDFFQFRENCLKVQQILHQKLDESYKSDDSETPKNAEPFRKKEGIISKLEVDIDDERVQQIDEVDLGDEEIEEQLEEYVIEDLDQSIEQLEETDEEIEEVVTDSNDMFSDDDGSQRLIFDVRQAYEKAKQEVYAAEMMELLNHNKQNELRENRASRSSAKKSTRKLQSNPKITGEIEPSCKKKRRTSKTEKEIYRSLLLTCEICGKAVERSRMEGHHNQHLNVRPYVCSENGCNATFTSKIGLQLHTNYRHTGEQLPCDLCGKMFTSKKAVYQHRRETHAEKQFKCEQCGMVFVSRSRLRRHKFSHLDQREFKCPHCPQEFYRNNNLKVHLRSHTKEKPFACNWCDKAFGYNRLLKDHISRHHQNNC
ncbi:zinc finger protein OZF-like [Toxorhynchites rutilus septentrionalis]|uniref:zinc finger protein OZF-like n=1 Tax=Toxorhynchites rutilus septentrionalis TaxID=329112 RepID=UPI00247A6B18|nr:zinc finger protein OZF-like [Toxorhynchites rutilus septentrionalis]